MAHHRTGITLIELALAVSALALVLGVGLPALLRVRDKVQLNAARRALTARHALARQVAAQYGRVGRLHIDSVAGRVWVTVDTSESPWSAGSVDTAGVLVDLEGRFGVTISATTPVICFGPRGLATAAGDCSLPNATLVLRRGGAADTLAVSRLGRLRLKR